VPRRPLIAITGTSEIIRGISRVRVNEAYTNSVERAGMLPVVVPPLNDERRAAAIAASVDGLLLTGGEDVDPSRYGAAPRPETDAPHLARDRSEIALVIAAKTIALPTLAICRGLQILNVALGGTLIQDIPSERPGALAHAPGGARDRRAHPVHVREGSRLAIALGGSDVEVNSSHHQALDRIAPDITVTASAPDGIVEGAESSPGSWWMLGVQWHPEELTETSEGWDRALFDTFRDAAAAHAQLTHAAADEARAARAQTTGSAARR
jgi:putative glutamine amidotransferase